MDIYLADFCVLLSFWQTWNVAQCCRCCIYCLFPTCHSQAPCRPFPHKTPGSGWRKPTHTQKYITHRKAWDIGNGHNYYTGKCNVLLTTVHASFHFNRICTYIHRYTNGQALILICGQGRNSHYDVSRSGQESWFLINTQGQTHKAAADIPQYMHGSVWHCGFITLTSTHDNTQNGHKIIQDPFRSKSVWLKINHYQCRWLHCQNKMEALCVL